MGRLLRPLALAALVAFPAAGQSDPFYDRLRGVVKTSFPSFRGADCVTIDAPRGVVFRLLISPEKAAQWLLADIDDVVPRRSRYRKGPAASTNDTLVLDLDLPEGPRKVELTVLALLPGQLLSLRVAKDDAGLTQGLASLTHTLFVETAADGTTDLWWANHFDPETPFAALSTLGGKRGLRGRRETGLLYLKEMAEAAARTPAPPLHEAPR